MKRSLLDHITDQVLTLAKHNRDLALWTAMCIEAQDFKAALYLDTNDQLVATILVPAEDTDTDDEGLVEWVQVVRVPVHHCLEWTPQDSLNVLAQLTPTPSDARALDT